MRNLAMAALFLGCASATFPQGTVQPSMKPLQSIIQKLQFDDVKESCGTEAYQCFTDIDYENFSTSKKAQQIAEEQRQSQAFRNAAMALASIPEPDRSQAVKPLRQPLRKTWGELHEISCKGQTEAGNRAERDIANALADVALELARSGAGTKKK